MNSSKIFYGCRIHAARLLHSSSVVSSRTNAVVDSIIRVDHAGELGADRIYAGQMAILGKTKMGPVIQHMWDQEKVHKETFEKLIVKYRVRPTVMVPVWNIAGFVLGAGTALMGEKAAMACTVAVESVIVDHYNDQLRTLMAEPEKNRELLETIQKFRDDEQEHHDSGLDHGAEQAPFYKGLTEVIKLGCKTAIAISKGFGSNSRGAHCLWSRSYCTASPRRKWDLYCGVCVERKPTIQKDLTPLEEEYFKYLARVHVERSYKSDHEVRCEEDERRMESLKSEGSMSTDELEKLSMQTGKEFEDSCSDELDAFAKADRITDADKADDVKSLRRQLQNHLLLVVNEKIGGKRYWILPHGTLGDGESLRAAAERILRERCGNDLSVTFLGNAPCGYHKYKYPKSLRSESEGAKIFFLKAIYASGQVAGGADFRWATRSELVDLLTDDYLDDVEMFLIDDDHDVRMDAESEDESASDSASDSASESESESDRDEGREKCERIAS